MKNIVTKQHLSTTALLFFLAGTLSCNAQENNKVKNNVTEPIGTVQAKFAKTQGSNQYANVHCGLQDKNGTLWFGATGEGVYRYDGKAFIQYTVKDGLTSNTVWCIFEDKSGMIWFGTDNGACRYDGKTITKIPVKETSGINFSPSTTQNEPVPVRMNVWSIMQDKSGKLWFATTEGVFCYTGAGFTRFPQNTGILLNSGFKLNSVEYILEDKAGNFWFGGRGNGGAFRYDGKSLTNLKVNGDNWVWPVLEDRTGKIWFSNWSGAFRYDGKSFTFFSGKDCLSLSNITRITEDKKGNMWFGSDSGGLCRYDAASSAADMPAFTHFDATEGLTSKAVWTILEDNKGDLWIGTRNVGLYRFDGKVFSSF